MAEDDAILSGFLAGDENAVGVVRGWVVSAVRLGRWRLRDPEAAGQEIVLRLIEIVRSGHYERRSNFRTFVQAVARHTCVDLFRRERLRGRTETDVEPPPAATVAATTSGHPHHTLLAREELEILNFVLQGLPEECRRLWGWVYGDGLSAAEVGRLVGANAGTVRVRVHRCIQRAREVAQRYVGGAGLILETPRR